MKELFSALLRDYATAVTVTTGQQSIATRAFVQPVRSASAHEKKISPLGMVEPGQTVYIGPADVPIKDATIRCRGVRYRTRRTETLLLGDSAVYTWGVLTREGEEEADV